MSYVNHAEAGERATIHTRRTTTARDRARRGDETECLVRERELKALTRARRGTRAPGRVRCPPARPRAASPGDAASRRETRGAPGDDKPSMGVTGYKKDGYSRPFTTPFNQNRSDPLVPQGRAVRD